MGDELVILELFFYVGAGLWIVDLSCALFSVREDSTGDSKCMSKFMLCVRVRVCVCWVGGWTSMLEIVFV